MLNLQTAKTYVPYPKFETLPLVQVARTSDIIREVVACCEADQIEMKKLAPHFKGATILETCKNIYDFFRVNVKYVADDIKKMIIKSPARVLHDGFADCKGLSIAIKSALNNLGIQSFFRFVGYNEDREVTHVYVVALDENGKHIFIDACIDRFNYELPYNPNVKKDMAGTSIVKMNGVPEGYTEYHSYVMCPCSCGNKGKVAIGFGPDFGNFASGGNTSGGGFNWETVGGIVDIIRGGVGVVKEIKDVFSGGGNNPAPSVPVFVPSASVDKTNDTPPPAQDNTMFYIGGVILAYVLLTQNSKKK